MGIGVSVGVDEVAEAEAEVGVGIAVGLAASDEMLPFEQAFVIVKIKMMEVSVVYLSNCGFIAFNMFSAPHRHALTGTTEAVSP